MNLSVSNIGWSGENDLQVYNIMKSLGFTGLEIAPTRVFPDDPYGDPDTAKKWSEQMLSEYGFRIPSMQSIWFGRSEKIFGSEEERQVLVAYTKKAIEFAEAVGCGNLVFGCPKNRNLPEGKKAEESFGFFKEISDYAFAHNCVIAMEANPPIYNTNFLNTTEDALDFIKKVDSDGFLLNLDVGTMVENSESPSILAGNKKYINHVHISEPGLKVLEKRDLHSELAEVLRDMDYDRFVSIEVGRQDDISVLAGMMEYVKGIFG